jgi:hypothetical protein
MQPNSYISLHRSILSWEWYDDVNVKIAFIHLLLTVNWKDEMWHGILVKRGQRVVSIEKLGAELKLKRQPMRTIICKLKSTSEITVEIINGSTVMTVLQYDKYQTPTNKPTTEQPSSNQETTIEQPLYNNIIINKEITYTENFEKFYELYPNPFNKEQTFKNFKKLLKLETFENIMVATKNYINELNNKKIPVEKEFIKRSTNFIGKEKYYKAYLERQVSNQSTIEDKPKPNVSGAWTI